MASKELEFERRAVAAGTAIFREGDPGDALYVVEHGRVRLYRDTSARRVHLATVSDGAVFGEMAAIDHSHYHTTAEAEEDTTLLRVSTGVLTEKLKRADPFIRRLLHITIDNLRTAHTQFAQRPRSLRDILAVMEDHSGCVRDYINAVGVDEISTETLHDLEHLDKLLGRLRAAIEPVPDRRRDVIAEPEDKRAR
jgi:CRP-like cAMP-binding protein